MLTGQLHTVATLSSPSEEVKRDTHLKGLRRSQGWSACCGENEISCPYQKSKTIPRSSILQRSPYTNWANLTPVIKEINTIIVNEILINKQNSNS